MLCCHGVSSSSFPNSKNGSGFRLTLLTQMISMEWDRTEYNLSGGHWHENFSNTHVSTYCRQYWGHRWYCSESSMEMPGNSRFQTIGNIFENFIVQAKFSMRTVLYQFEGNIAWWKRPNFPHATNLVENSDNTACGVKSIEEWCVGNRYQGHGH